MQPTTITTTLPQKSSVQSLATTLNVNPAELQQIIVNTIMPAGATAEEVGALMLIANTYKLNPLLKQIAVFKTKNNGLMPMVMIDGWIKIMHDHPKFNGMEQVDSFDGDKSEWSVATKIYVKGIEHPISIKEYYDECYVPQKAKENGQQNFDAAPWDKWPKRMLRHKSLIQGIRYALGIGGIYDQDELLRMDAIEAEIVPVNSYINGPQRVIPSYSDIEAAVKAMGLTLELRKEYGKDWAYANGETFSVKAELAKLGFITKKNAQLKWDTKMDVTLNLQQKPTLSLPEETNKDFDINTIQGLEQFISGNGFSMEIKPSGKKVFAKVNIDVDDEGQVGFVTELGFKRVKDVYVRDVTSIPNVA
ncbi:MAG: RecT family recombinase [Candidatus Paceibacterota bacterium]